MDQLSSSDLVRLELVKLIPSVGWIIFAIVVVALFYRPLRYEVIPHLSSFRAMGIELSLIQDSFNAAVKLAEKSPQWKVVISPEAEKNVMNRIREHMKIFKGTQILWVDDHPENNINERKMLFELRAEIETARSTGEAVEMASSRKFDVIYSDMRRGDDPGAGLELLAKLKGTEYQSIPVIFYIGIIEPEKGAPPGSFGITNRPDELVHLTLDALERRKY